MVRLIGKCRAWYCAVLAALLIAALFYGCTGDEANIADMKKEDHPSEIWEGLSAETEKQICREYVREFYVKRPSPHVGICRYYGTYNGYAIVILEWSGIISEGKCWHTVIGGIDLREPDAPNAFLDKNGMIAAWKDGHFYSIADLYKEGMLTLENLKQIAGRQEKSSGMELYPFTRYVEE